MRSDNIWDDKKASDSERLMVIHVRPSRPITTDEEPCARRMGPRRQEHAPNSASFALVELTRKVNRTCMSRSCRIHSRVGRPGSGRSSGFASRRGDQSQLHTKHIIKLTVRQRKAPKQLLTPPFILTAERNPRRNDSSDDQSVVVLFQ